MSKSIDMEIKKIDHLRKEKDNKEVEKLEGYTKFNSYHALILEPKLKKDQPRITEIFDRTIEWLLENKQGYYGYRWDEDTYHILKKESMDLFQISKEKENLVLYPFDDCSEKTLEDVCKEINESMKEIEIPSLSDNEENGGVNDD